MDGAGREARENLQVVPGEKRGVERGAASEDDGDLWKIVHPGNQPTAGVTSFMEALERADSTDLLKAV